MTPSPQSREEGTPIVRHSFIQISKLTNLKGRINYIFSHARQENLYAVYDTTERKFWSELAKCKQEEFEKSGTEVNVLKQENGLLLCQRVLWTMSRI